MRGPRSSSTIHVLTINWEPSIVREKHTSRMILRVLKAGLFPTSVGVASSSKPYCHSRNQVPKPVVQASAGVFSILLQRDAAAHVLLASYLDSTSVPPEYGGQVRLIVYEHQVAGSSGAAN